MSQTQYESESARTRPERMLVAMIRLGIDAPDALEEAMRDHWEVDYTQDVLWEAMRQGMVFECHECGRLHADPAYARECCEVRDASYYGVAHLFGAHAL